MKIQSRSPAILASLTLALSSHAQVVINEIYYHPPHAANAPEPVGLEWLELHNPTASPVDLGGWALVKGVDFPFPPGTLLPAGGFLVVAADTATFQTAHPGVTNVVGGWTGRLSNSAESLELVNAVSARVDRVEYADEGDWALRGRGPVVVGWAGHQGWDWFTDADGGGSSKERVSALLAVDCGQNWADCPSPGGTPGAANASAAADIAPVIRNVQNRPRVPRSSDPVRVTAEVTDDLGAPVGVDLYWRRDGTNTWNRTPMTDPDGDGAWEVLIPAHANLTILEYHVEASDGARARTWPAPARTSAPGVLPATFDQVCNALVQVDDSHNPAAAWVPGAQPVYRLILTAAERAEFRRLQEDDDSQTARIEAAMNASFVSTDGTGQETRHLCSVRNRGFSSRNGPPNHFSIGFPSTDPWKGRASFQMNCRYPHTAMLSANIFKLAGLPVQESAGAQLRVNGLNPAASGQGVGAFTQSITHGALARTESLGGDWVANHFPADPDGNLYRVDDHNPGNSGNSNDFRHPGSTNPDVYDDIYLKQTNADLNDFTDLSDLFLALNATTTNSAVFMAGVRQRANLDQWIDYLILDALVGNMEGGLGSGRTDDFSMYRGVLDPRFVLIPHDFDTTLGQNSPSGLNRSLFSYIDNSNGGSVAGLTKLFADPEFLHLYYKRTLALCASLYTSERLNPLIDQTLTGWVPAATITAIRNFVVNRRTNILNQVPRVNAFPQSGITTSTSTLVDGMKQTPDGAATLTGQFDTTQVRAVRVNGRVATLQWRTTTSPAATAGRWVLAAVAGDGLLARGVTRVVAEYFPTPDATGLPVFTAYQDILNTSGAPTTVQSNGQPAGNVVTSRPVLLAPSQYLPGVPFLVAVEYRFPDGSLDRGVSGKRVDLTAGAVSVRDADTGAAPARVSVFQGRGAALVLPAGASTNTTVLVSRGGTQFFPSSAPATWRFHSASTTLAPAADAGGRVWYHPNYDAAAWSTGTGEFGYEGPTGNQDQRTTLANVGSSRLTWYFRHAFQVPAPLAGAAITLRLLADDGAAVYLNGVEIPAARRGLPAHPAVLAHTTAATRNLLTSGTVPLETQFETITLPAGNPALLAGTNTLAVEVHNHATTGNADLSFDLELAAALPSTNPGDFTLTATEGTNVLTSLLTSLGATPAQTVVSGALPAGTNTWSGVVRVTADTLVPAGATLVVQAGAQVILDGTPAGPGAAAGAGLDVAGTLRVEGTEALPVTFACSSDSNRWGRVRLRAGAPAATVRGLRASRGGHAAAGGNAAVAALFELEAGARLTLEDSILSDSPACLLRAVSPAALSLLDVQFHRGVAGVEVTGSGSPVLTGCHLVEMRAARREGGTAGEEDGLRLAGVAASVTDTGISGCDDDGVDLASGSALFTGCVVNTPVDKGFALLDQSLVLRRTRVENADVGISTSISAGAAATAFPLQISYCSVRAEAHPANLADGNTHGVALHARNRHGTSTFTVPVTVQDSILSAEVPVLHDYGNTAAYPGAPFPQTTVNRTCLHDSGGTNPADPLPAGVGNLAADPLFVDLALPDLHLTGSSPCIDAANPADADPDGSRADMGAIPFGTDGVGAGALIRWTLAGSPYQLTTNTTIAAGTTLEVAPGVSVWFNAGVRLTVRGRMLAEGTALQRIRFGPVPGANVASDVDPIKNGTQTGLPKWGGIRVIDSLAEESRFVHCDFVNAQGTNPTTEENYGSLGFIRSRGHAEGLTFAGTHLRMLYGRNCVLTVVRCAFPDMFLMDTALGRVERPSDFLASADNRMEPLKVEYPTTDAQVNGNPAYPNGLPSNGWFRVYANTFNGNRGHQDVFDADSGRWNQPGQFLLDCRYNIFNGISGDEHIDLGGDAYIAHNLFRRASKDAYTVDTGYSNCISSGDKGSGTTIWVVRNVAIDVDHLINCKIRTAAVVEHNTCLDFHQDWFYDHGTTQQVNCAVVNLYVPNDGNAAGDGAYLAHNILHGNVPAPDDTVSPDPPGGFPRLVSWADRDLPGSPAKTSVLQIDHNFIDSNLLDATLGANHPGGVFDPAHGTGNVTGDPRIRDKAALDFGLAADSPARGSAPGGLDYGATIPEWIYLLGAPAPTTSATTVTLTVGGPGMVAFKWRLDNGPWSAPQPIGTGALFTRTLPFARQATLTLPGLANGPHRVEVLGQDPAGNWQDADPARTLLGLPQLAPTAVAFTVDTSLAGARLNEVAAGRGGLPDWVELLNPGTAPLDLAGWALSDTPALPEVPIAGIVPAGGFLVADLSASGPALDADGDEVCLWNGSNLVDRVVFGTQAAGYTLGRDPVSDAWGVGLPSSNAVNRLAPTGDPFTLRIAEVFASGRISFADDWIELSNPSAAPVALAGLRLTDNPPGFPAGSVLPPLGFIGPGARALFLATGAATASGNRLTFSLDAQQESVFLLAPDGRIIDQAVLFPATDDASLLLDPARVAGYALLPSPGFEPPPGDPGHANALALLQGLRVTEIMYNATGGNAFDWIELRNTGATPLQLAGAAFIEGIDFTFGALSLDPGRDIVVVADLASFRARYGEQAAVAGVYAGRLDNGGETLALALPAPYDATVLRFTYGDTWQPSTDGQGYALEIVSPLALRPEWDDRSSWTASAAFLGTPDSALARAPTGYANWKSFYLLTADDTDVDADGALPLLEYALGTSPRSALPAAVPTDALAGWASASQGAYLNLLLPEVAGASQNHGLPGVRYEIQWSTSPSGPVWTTLASKTHGTPWSGPATPGAAVSGMIPVSVGDLQLPAGPIYYRVKISYEP